MSTSQRLCSPRNCGYTQWAGSRQIGCGRWQWRGPSRDSCKRWPQPKNWWRCCPGKWRSFAGASSRKISAVAKIETKAMECLTSIPEFLSLVRFVVSYKTGNRNTREPKTRARGKKYSAVLSFFIRWSRPEKNWEIKIVEKQEIRGTWHSRRMGQGSSMV